MSKLNKGRMTALTDEGVVVFLIGMRINNVFAFRKWVPVFMAMGKMLPELYKNPQLGFKSYQMWFSRTLILVQYWESSEKLLEYAKATNSEHLPAWKEFNRAARASNAAGIWHETYVVPKGGVENMYVNMPTFGFGKVGDLVPATGKLNAAKDRFVEK